MPVSARTRAAARQFLDPDDEIVYIFPAELPLSARPSVIIVVSRKAVKVLSTGHLSRSIPKSVEVEYPRQTRLGPVVDHLGYTFRLGGMSYEVDEEYVAVVNAADLERGAGELPPDPLPDLCTRRVPLSGTPNVGFGHERALRLSSAGNRISV